MARASTDVILACLDDIRAGRRSLEACVAEHPEAAEELQALASITSVLRLDGTPHLPEDARARGRNQLLAAMSANGHRPQADRAMVARLAGWRGRLVLPRWAAALGGSLAALAAGSAVVYAAQGAPPESLLYPVRQAVQAVTQVVVPAQPAPAVEPTPRPTATSVAQASNTLVLPPPGRAATPSVGVVRDDQPAAVPSQSRRPDGDRDDGRDRQSPVPAASAATAPPQEDGNGRRPERKPDLRGDDDGRFAASANPGLLSPSGQPTAIPGRGGVANARDGQGRDGRCRAAALPGCEVSP